MSRKNMKGLKLLGDFVRLGASVLWLIALWRIATALGMVNEKWLLVSAVVLSVIGSLIIIAREYGMGRIDLD